MNNDRDFEDEAQEAEEFVVRSLGAQDLDNIVRIDAHASGRARPEYYRIKLKRALEETSVRISLAAEKDNIMVGFLMASVYYGDFGQFEPVATLEDISVLPSFAKRGVGRALFKQFVRNVKAMRVERIQTQVDWSNWALLSFLRRMNFMPAPRICIERRLDFEKDD